ncbi:gamma adaptin ear containing, arf binding protein, variant 2 [Parelaphostrongylus tenuis]|uniref:Gamma adaptin ear containing, arf binding protein, variant 2 n=1 Tax=Parelaphostrongylus tenuis TaxID=148309 RepID=A0AAD5M566_PARTN|nr:gamma adaptin ear containing, arf binding protein, variant 2 [Parelaphostrongylus tenuis]
MQKLLREMAEVNHLLQKYRSMPQAGRVLQHKDGTSEEVKDLLGPEPGGSSTSPASSSIASDFIADDLLEQKSNNLSNSNTELADVPFIGFDRSMTPAMPRKLKNPTPVTSSVLDDLTTLIDVDLFVKQTSPQPFKIKKPSLNDLCMSSSSMPNDSINSLDSWVKSSFESSMPSTLPEKVEFDSKAIQIANLPPKTVLNKQDILILLYSCLPQQQHRTVRSFIVTIINTNVDTLRYLQLKMNTTNKKASVRLEDKGPLELNGMSPIAPIATVHLLLYVLLLDEIHEIDLDFALTYTKQFEYSISGNVVVQL